MSEWLAEEAEDGMEVRLLASRVLFRGRSPFQRIAVFENPLFGRVLMLDDVFQTSERDEFIYHEMMVHPALLGLGDRARRVLVIGGGDGGTLREVLRHPVERVTMVELDRMVVDVCREHLPALGAGAFDDPRVELRFADGRRFVAETGARFDAILVDSTDPWPEGPGTVLFTEAFYRDCRRILRRGGVLVAQCGVDFVHGPAVAAALRRLGTAFPATAAYRAAVPLYAGGDMVFGLAGSRRGTRLPSAARLRARIAALGLATRYYSPEVHRAAFTRPALHAGS